MVLSLDRITSIICCVDCNITFLPPSNFVFIIQLCNAQIVPKSERLKRLGLPATLALGVLDDQANYLKSKGIISPLIFPATDGGTAREDSVYGSWVTYRNTVGISACTPYEMRHTFVTFTPNIPDAVLRPMIGHSTRMDTRRIYGHQTSGQLADAAEIVNANFIAILQRAGKNNAKNPSGL